MDAKTVGIFIFYLILIGKIEVVLRQVESRNNT